MHEVSVVNTREARLLEASANGPRCAGMSEGRKVLILKCGCSRE
jgi:hypothetical protein